MWTKLGGGDSACGLSWGRGLSVCTKLGVGTQHVQVHIYTHV